MNVLWYALTYLGMAFVLAWLASQPWGWAPRVGFWKNLRISLACYALAFCLLLVLEAVFP